MKIFYECKKGELTATDASFFFVCKETLHDTIARISKSIGNSLSIPLELGDIATKEEKVTLLYPQKKSVHHTKRVIFIGLGDQNSLSTEKFRKAAARASKEARELKLRSMAMEIPEFRNKKKNDQLEFTNIVAAIAEGALLGLYSYDKYITAKERKNHIPSVFIICNPESKLKAEGHRSLHRASIISSSVILTRDLVNAPSNEMDPEALARAAHASARKYGYRAVIFNKRKIERLGMGGLIAVNRGSSKPPCFITLEYGRKKKGLGTVVLVGKGITFDSGGISIKPPLGMGEMKTDMAGAAAVIGTMEAAARLHLRIHLIGLIPATENMPSGSALKPGDIIRHYNGLTTEVDNTDAEGRLILADALAYAEKFKPTAMIDLATLTGACVVALGHHATGMFGNNEKLMDRLRDASEKTYERVWQFPLFEEYEKQIRSHVADVRNTGGRWAGAITAALFLKKFVNKHNWVHLDIAGTAFAEESHGYLVRGATGVGVRLLTELLSHWEKL